MHPQRQKLAMVFLCCIALLTTEAGAAGAATGGVPPSVTRHADQDRAQLEQLVAPIALYPDPLVSNVLEAAQYPDQIAEAAQWMDTHAALSGQTLERELNQQPWDPSVKALTDVPAVLANMDQNMSWTTALADAYVNREQDLQQAVQDLRRRARAAGNLESNAQQTVTREGPTIEIQPTDPEIVYVPQYDPWIVYGDPLVAWPGWNWYPDLWWRGPGIRFDLGFRVGHVFHDGVRFHGGGLRGGGFRGRRR